MKIEKEDLINYIFTKNFLKDRIDELEERKKLLNKLIATYGDTPKATSEIQDRVAEGLATLMDKTKEYEDQLIVEQEKLNEIENIIEKMSNKLHRNILYGKYIRGKKFSEIADLEGYNEKYIITLNGFALQDFEKIISNI